MAVEGQATHNVAISQTDKCTTTPNRRSCVSWLLLASYAVLLGIAVVGVSVSVNNLWEEPRPPPPPPGLENGSGNAKRTYDENDFATEKFRKAMDDARLCMYVVLPGAVCVLVAASVLGGGLGSHQLFSFTFSLYNSLGMWILTLAFVSIHRSEAAWNTQMNLDVACWVQVFHAALMLLQSAQVLLCVWELRRQRAGWPTSNFLNLFTLEAVLMLARTGFTVNIFMSLGESVLLRGPGLYQDNPSVMWTLVLLMVCCSATCYNAVATGETVLSMLFGKLHPRMTIVTSLLSTLCCIAIVVVNSPDVLRAINPSQQFNYQPRDIGVRLSVITFAHLIFCIIASSTIRSPPNSLRELLDLSKPSRENGVVSKQSLDSDSLQKTGESYVILNRISAVFSLCSIAAILCIWSSSPYHREWGLVLVLCVNCAALGRTLPPSLMEILFKEIENKSVNQRLMAVSLECIPLLVGAIAACVGGSVVIGTINIAFSLFQACIYMVLKEKLKATQPEEGECSAEIEKVYIEGKNNEQHDKQNDCKNDGNNDGKNHEHNPMNNAPSA